MALSGRAPKRAAVNGSCLAPCENLRLPGIPFHAGNGSLITVPQCLHRFSRAALYLNGYDTCSNNSVRSVGAKTFLAGASSADR
jgi:hypothetical protein